MSRSITTRSSEYLPPASDEQDEKTITCCICQAVYAPSRSHGHLQQGSSIVLESALMSLCHFCFRCRRPSCPACWDDVHGVCGQCAEEIGLPFRNEATPPSDAQLAPSRFSTTPAHARIAQSSLVNIRPGHFQRSSQPTIGNIPTRPGFTGPRQEMRAQRPLEIDEIQTRPDQKRSPSSPDVAAMPTHPQRSGRGGTP